MEEKTTEKYLGIDVGSTTVKACLMEEGGKILYSSYVRHYSRVRECVLSELEKIRPLAQRFHVCITGSAGLGIAQRGKIPFVQEVQAAFGAIRRTGASFLTLGANEAARIGAGSLIRLSGENATNLLAECVGGGVPYSETPGSSRISIVPWAGASSFSTQESFETSTEAHDPALPVAFDAALGFVTLPESSLLDGLSTATPEDNVLISEAAVTLETDAAANCLVLKTWGTTLDLNTNTLTLASGLLLHRNTKPTLRNGTLALGTEPLRAFGRQNLTISSTVTSPNTDPDATIILTASAGGGGLVLSGDNRGLIGTILVAAGTLSATGYGVPDTVGIELCRGTRYPVTWGGATSRARAIGGIGAIQAGDAKNRLLIGAAEPSAATGVWVGPGGALTPGERNPLTGRRSGTLTVGDKFTHIVFQGRLPR